MKNIKTAITTEDISTIKDRILYHSFFRKGKQYVTVNGREFKVNALVNFLRVFGAL